MEVFLIHPGGPFWANRDESSWSIPKGEYLNAEEPLKAAQREFQEETGFPVEGEFHPIGSIKQSNGKTVQAWACEGDLDATAVQSNTFRLEWPPRSGNFQEFPEADRGEWFSLPLARKKILKIQLAFLENLEHLLRKKSDTQI